MPTACAAKNEGISRCIRPFARLARRVPPTRWPLLAVLLPALLTAGFHARIERIREDVYVVRYIERPDGTRSVIRHGVEKRRGARRGITAGETGFPQAIDETGIPLWSAWIVELQASDLNEMRGLLADRHVTSEELAPSDQVTIGADEVETLVESGPPGNRIDVVLMGDGYTAEQRDNFRSDMACLVTEMFRDSTFESYLPLLNIHTVFRPSRESGIGLGVPKNTAYGSFRPADAPLRVVSLTNPGAARESCSAAPDCDYPVVVANDPFYGGLGGEFAITTSSPTSGTVVLRHELGHNFGEMGEEYDGGSYFGANHAPVPDRTPWLMWLAPQADPLATESARASIVSWPWHDLARGPFRRQFTAAAGFPTATVQVSVGGLSSGQTAVLRIDDTAVPIAYPGHSDRFFQDIPIGGGLFPGPHSLEFALQAAPSSPATPIWLCMLNIHQYGSGYVFEPDFVSRYPLFSQQNVSAGYRPTHDGCLMRKMNWPRFCPVCRENLWLKFLRKTSLIDDLTVAIDSRNRVNVQLSTLKLGEQRQTVSRSIDAYPPGEHLSVRWLHDGVEDKSLEDLFDWRRKRDDCIGQWEVQVRFVTPEVRQDPDGLLIDVRDFAIEG